MKHVIIGTAGHVDHGKSALIKALTGTDTDRLKEEKQRGISIDLGFASLALGKSILAGIVDVPGHERFLKNMLAGTGGIDMVMLVIAADEGVMAQTREHLAMLNLYGVKHGLVVISKIDKVDAEWLEMVQEDIKELLKDTFLAHAPICRVSSLTGEGLDGLRATLENIAAKVPVRDSEAPFRLWVDRAFTVKGHGIVVTGTALSGSVKVGGSLVLYPNEQTVRVRGLEWHGKQVDAVSAGQRAAINLAGIELLEIERGMVLSERTRGQVGTRWDIMITWHQEVPSGTRVRLHIGTSEYLGRIYALRDASSRYMRLVLEAPLGAAAGDRGIIRLYSPQHLLGGVTLVGVAQRWRRLGSTREELAHALVEHNLEGIIFHGISEHKKPLVLEDIRRQAGYWQDAEIEKMLKKLIAQGKIQTVENNYISIQALDKLTLTLNEMLKKFHKEQPDRPGLSKETIRQKMSIDERAFEALLGYWQTKKLIVVNGADIALKAHADKHGGWQRDLVANVEESLEGIGLVDINPALLVEKAKVPQDKAQAAHITLVRQGVLVRIGEIHVYRKTIQNIARLIHQYFEKNAIMTVAELRDLLNTSRKIAVPLMEYLDLHKYTVRDGDVRRAGSKLQGLHELSE